MNELIKREDRERISLIRSFFQWFKLRYGKISFHFMDYIVIGYSITLGLLVISFHFDHNLQQNVNRWWIYPIGHLALVFLIMEMLRLATQYTSRFLLFIRTFYPAILLTFAWTELNQLIPIIFPFWANDLAINLDKAIFTVHPTVWVERFFTPWLTELMNFFYVTYYLYVPILGFLLYFHGKKQETLDFLSLVFFTLTITFLLYIIFPVEGARTILAHLHTNQSQGWIFTKLVRFIQQQGGIRGGALPSTHVAATFTIVWATIRYQRRLGFILLPFAFGVAVSTVYLQYHHAVDAWAGIIWGTVMYWAGIKILVIWKNHKAKIYFQKIKSKKVQGHHAANLRQPCLLK